MTEHKIDMDITKIEKYKKLNMTEYKIDVNITNIKKYKKNPTKMNSTSITGHKTDMNMIKVNKYRKLNSTSTTVHKTEHSYTLVNQEINIHKSNKGVTNLKTPHEKD